jgi:hypothetical protein
MPTPTIPAGNLFMNATTYSGTGAAASVANGSPGASFQPDLAWIKARNDTSWNQVFDSVRGVNKGIYTNDTYQETTQTDAFNSFNSNGMGLGADAAGGSVNKSGNTYVGWQWKAGGTAVSNTSGTITSSVSANTTSGFSVVTYTGNGTNGASIGHGLGVTPAMVIMKTRSAVDGWVTYHQSIPSPTSNYLVLNTTAATAVASGFCTPSSSTITFTTSYGGTNGSGVNLVAYCWAPIAGYSQFGSYTGNGSTDGTFVYTGFRPRFIMVKCSSNSSTNWFILDTARDTYNLAGQSLEPNLSNAEYSPASSGYYGDILSNGFKWRDASNNANNANGYTYIYMAFAENPLKFSNAR